MDVKKKRRVGEEVNVARDELRGGGETNMKKGEVVKRGRRGEEESCIHGSGMNMS